MRRARIKAVISLPPRKKNAEIGAVNNKDQDQTEDNSKNLATKLKTTQSNNEDTDIVSKDFNKASIKSPPPPLQNIKSPSRIMPSLVHVPTPEPTSLEALPSESQSHQNQTKKPMTPIADKVPVIITSSASFTHDIFISPRSPYRRLIPSPAVKTQKIELDVVKKCVAPDRDNVVDNRSEIEVSAVKLGDDSENCHSNNSKINNDGRNNVLDDVSTPASVRESIESVSEDSMMDGIVPLQTAENAPKPIALLKNEIISENVEVYFDPIVPLPSPSKVRPKLRPVPRLAPFRRNSIQGSASESEDETRRALQSGSVTPAPMRPRLDSLASQSTQHSTVNRETNRTRYDSVCSSVSQTAGQPPLATSPQKEKHFSKSRRQEMSRRIAAMRRRREAVKRETLTMYDLIFYNPTTNPIIPDQDELNAEEANKQEAKKIAQSSEDENESPEREPAPAVPQIKIGPNGEIILDEKSMVVKQSGSSRKVRSVVREGAWGGGGAYRRSARTADWPAAETLRFYRALAAIGTDFTLMEPLFPGRTRRDLKLKFKKEEKLNGAQIDKALRAGVHWDATRLQEEFESERAGAARRAAAEESRLRAARGDERQRARAARLHRLRLGKGSKVLESSAFPGNHTSTADDIIEKALERKKRRKRKISIDIPPPNPRETISVTPSSLEPTTPQFATLTLLINKSGDQHKSPAEEGVETKTLEKPVTSAVPIPNVPMNIEGGSLVVLTVNDPNSPTKKMLQTYIAHGEGKLTPVALPSHLMSSVVGYMRKGTPKGSGVSTAGSSPQLISPSSVASQGGRTSTPGMVTNCSPMKRQRHSSFTMTQL